ncbi:hypothetical protein BD626DRAFT_554587 [Schizophyllum amplum]|uniref:F-box domain-containing protein n=1 Tax=Schizophyllum amplum TaxID=97359 RepID=A0A550CRJ8_9AGAR|nr:hypothetical protein BD626DRAFT_554587 [Auriculariopsis ampla]
MSTRTRTTTGLAFVDTAGVLELLAPSSARADTLPEHPFMKLRVEDLMTETANHERRRSVANWQAVQVLRALRTGWRPTMKTFGLLGEFPLDIVYEIMQHAHPMDLYHLSQTCRAMRELLTVGAGAVWAASFARHSETMPPCPPDVPPPQWATMLFAPHRCQQCGRGAAAMDFTLLRRLCSKCLVTLPLVETAEDEFAASLVPRTYREDGDHYFEYDDGRYLPADLQAVIQAVAKHRQSMDQKMPGSELDFERYKLERHALVASRTLQSTACRVWAEKLGQDASQARKALDKHFARRIRARLSKAGHHPADLEKAIAELPASMSVPRLTRRKLEKIIPIVERAVVICMEERIAEERYARMRERRARVSQAYTAYRGSTLPATWAYHPSSCSVAQYAPFAELVHSPDMEAEEFERRLRGAVSLLPQFVRDWTRERMHHMVSLLPAASAPSSSAASTASSASAGTPSSSSSAASSSASCQSCPAKPPAPAQVPDAAILSRLDLATSIYHCPVSRLNRSPDEIIGKGMVGWDGAGPHLNCAGVESEGLCFDRRGYDAARGLLELVGLDPDTALAREFDSLNARFVCANCPTDGPYDVLTWRECVIHMFNTAEDGTHRAGDWRLLSEPAANFVRRRESHPAFKYEHAWACNHCAVHYANGRADAQVTRTQAIKHARLSHNIERPVQNLDFVYVAGFAGMPRKPVGLRRALLPEYKCSRCHKGKTTLRAHESALHHLRNKHGIVSGILGIDFEKIEFFTTSTASLASAASDGTQSATALIALSVDSSADDGMSSASSDTLN